MGKGVCSIYSISTFTVSKHSQRRAPRAAIHHPGPGSRALSRNIYSCSNPRTTLRNSNPIMISSLFLWLSMAKCHLGTCFNHCFVSACIACCSTPAHLAQQSTRSLLTQPQILTFFHEVCPSASHELAPEIRIFCMTTCIVEAQSMICTAAFLSKFCFKKNRCLYSIFDLGSFSFGLLKLLTRMVANINYW